MLLFALLGLLAPWQFTDQLPPIGIIDFYGLRTVSESKVRQVHSFHEGDRLPHSEAGGNEL